LTTLISGWFTWFCIKCFGMDWKNRSCWNNYKKRASMEVPFIKILHLNLVQQ